MNREYLKSGRAVILAVAAVGVIGITVIFTHIAQPTSVDRNTNEAIQHTREGEGKWCHMALDPSVSGGQKKHCHNADVEDHVH